MACAKGAATLRKVRDRSDRWMHLVEGREFAETSGVASRARRTVRVWDLPLRLFHWLLVATIVVAFLSSAKDGALHDWHVLAGWVAAILIVFRILWGFVGGAHSRFGSFVPPSGLARHLRDLRRGRPEPSLGHNPLGAICVLLLLGMIAATVGTGVALMEDVHALIACALLGLIAVHVAAVLVMSLLTGDNLIRAMATGGKSTLDHPGAGDARRPGALALAAALLVLAGSVLAVRLYDPLAFSLRSADDYEHSVRGGAGGKSTEPEREHRRD